MTLPLPSANHPRLSSYEVFDPRTGETIMRPRYAWLCRLVCWLAPQMDWDSGGQRE